MESWQLYQWLVNGSIVLFVFAYGACVGSLTNVLVYRLPRGLDVITPTSRCPRCGTKLTFRENIPILGWLLLRGKCRFCSGRISPEYPVVETIVGVLFAALYVAFYIVPHDATWLGVAWGQISPEWARSDRYGWAATTWPIFTAFAVLVGGLVAMTIIDLRTYTVPLQIPWFVTGAALVLHMGGVGWVELNGHGHLRSTAPGAVWAIPTPGWPWLIAAIGGTVGLGISLVLMRTGLIQRSFADYDDWAREQGLLPPEPEAGEDEEHELSKPVAPDALLTEGSGIEPPAERGWVRPVVVHLLAVVGCGVLGAAVSALVGLPDWLWLIAGLVGGPLVATSVLGVLDRGSDEAEPPVAGPVGVGPVAATDDDEKPAEPEHAPPHEWILYPHARREMVRELAFLAAPVVLAFAGFWLSPRVITESAWSGEPPLWLSVLGGVLLGYLVGGGVVWAIRVLGTLLFGKEALGLGDVHMMAAVGACLGWIDATLGFFAGAFVGLYLTVLGALRSGRAARALPFVPSLAVGTAVIIVAKPLVEMLLNAIVPVPPGGTPINLP